MFFLNKKLYAIGTHAYFVVKKFFFLLFAFFIFLLRKMHMGMEAKIPCPRGVQINKSKSAFDHIILNTYICNLVCTLFFLNGGKSFASSIN
jgi:hypothetical protein